MEQTRTFGESIINWSWYLQGKFNTDDKTCHIYFHERWHNQRDAPHPAHEKNVRFEVLEDDKRTVYGVKVDGVEYRVTNPQNIFSYKDLSNIEWVS